MLVSSPAAEAVTSRWPRPLAAMRGSSERATFTCAMTWTWKDRCQSSSLPRSGPSATPALEHHRSTGPTSRSTRSTSAATAAGSVTSSPAPSGVAQASSRATRRAPGSSRSATTTARAPSRANRSASARPIPEAPPVTTATAPCRFMLMEPYGITIPFDGIPLPEQRELVAELPGLGYTDVWSSEAGGADAFTPLALASVWAPTLRLGTAIAPVFTRGPAGRGGAGPLHARDRRLLRRHRRALERPGVRPAVSAGPRHRAVPAGGARRRQGRRALPDLRGGRLPAAARPRAAARAADRRAAAGDAAAGGEGERRRGPHLAVARRRPHGGAVRARGRPRQADRGAHLCRGDRRRRGGARARPQGDRGLSHGPGLPGVPRVARPRRAAGGDVAGVGGRGPQGRAGGDPRRRGRRAGGARPSPALPRAGGALRRRGRDHAGAGAAAHRRGRPRGGPRAGAVALTPIFTQRIDPNFRRSRSGGGGRPTRERRPGGGRLGAAKVSRYAG